MMPENVEAVMFWSYPGSGEIKCIRNGGEELYITDVYTDEDGRQWGYVDDFQKANGWICMSDPSNDQIPRNEEEAANVVIPPEPDFIIEPQPESPNAIILIAAAIVVVVGMAVILIRVVFRGKKDKKEYVDN